MPDLPCQIGTLYRIVGQIESGRGAGALRARSSRQPDGSAASSRSSFTGRRGIAPLRWVCTIYCLWFSLPLSIWLSSGWIGLLLYWQVLQGVACLVEKLVGKPGMGAGAIEAGKDDAACSAIQHRARQVTLLAAPRALRQIP